VSWAAHAKWALVVFAFVVLLVAAVALFYQPGEVLHAASPETLACDLRNSPPCHYVDQSR
jgi:hypothetical protein